MPPPHPYPLPGYRSILSVRRVLQQETPLHPYSPPGPESWPWFHCVCPLPRQVIHITNHAASIINPQSPGQCGSGASAESFNLSTIRSSIIFIIILFVYISAIKTMSFRLVLMNNTPTLLNSRHHHVVSGLLTVSVVRVAHSGLWVSDISQAISPKYYIPKILETNALHTSARYFINSQWVGTVETTHPAQHSLHMPGCWSVQI